MALSARSFLDARWLHGLASLAALVAGVASADVEVLNPYMVRELWATGKLRTSAESDPDTVSSGHGNTVQPRGPGTSGGYGPHKIGRGPHRILGGSLGTAADFN